jgi:hypothetical protein
LGVAYRAGNLYVHLALGLPVCDATSGFRAYRRQVLEALTVYWSWQDGFAVTEVPITFTECATGASKMSGRIVAEALLRVTAWAVPGGRRPPASRHPGQVPPGGPLRAVAQRILRPRSSSTGRRAGCEVITAATRQWQAWPPESLIEPSTATNCQV